MLRGIPGENGLGKGPEGRWRSVLSGWFSGGTVVMKEAGEVQPKFCVELWNLDIKLELPTDVLFAHV